MGEIKSSNRHGCAYPAETRIRPSSLPVAPRRTALNFSNVITKIRQRQISPCTWVILAAQSTCRLPLGWGAPLFSPPTSSHFQTGLWPCQDDCLAPPSSRSYSGIWTENAIKQECNIRAALPSHRTLKLVSCWDSNYPANFACCARLARPAEWFLAFPGSERPPLSAEMSQASGYQWEAPKDRCSYRGRCYIRPFPPLDQS